MSMIPSPQMSLVKAQPKPHDNDPLSQDHQMMEKNSNEPLTKKQKRKHTVLACESCHNNHLKCNGAEPCQQCVKRHTDCRYSTPGKRGPKPGASSVLKSKLAQQEMSIQILTEELNRTKHEKEEWRQKYLSVVVSRPADIPLFQSVPETPEEIPSANLLKYLDWYKRYVHPLYPLPVALDKSHNLQYLNSTDPQHALISLQLSIVLAHGARMCQAHFDSNEFITAAKQKARDFFDQTSYELAHTFLLISYYFIGIGDKHKASYFNALVYKCCHDLNMLENTPVGKKCLSLFATMDELMDPKDDVLTKFQDIQPNTSELVWITFMQIYVGLHLAKVQSMPLLRKLEEVESIMSKNKYTPFEMLNLSTLVNGCRAGIFWNEKVKELGRDGADKCLEAFKSEEFHLCSPTVVPPVAMVIQINIAEKRLSQLQDSLVALDRLADVYPLADSVRKRFNSFFEATEQLLNSKNGNNSNVPNNLNTNGNNSAHNGSLNNNENHNEQSSAQDSSSGTNPSFSQPEMSLRLKRILDSDLDLLSLFREFGKTKEIPWLIFLNP